MLKKTNKQSDWSFAGLPVCSSVPIIFISLYIWKMWCNNKNVRKTRYKKNKNIWNIGTIKEVTYLQDASDWLFFFLQTFYRLLFYGIPDNSIFVYGFVWEERDDYKVHLHIS